MMIQRFTFAVLVASLMALLCAAMPAAQAAGDACELLRDLKLPDTTVTEATPVEAGAFSQPGSKPDAAPVQAPAFCRVAATIRPSPASHINIEVWLPQAADWNGSLLGTGNGGAGGAIMYAPLLRGVRSGFAVANTDMGTTTTGLDFSFGIGQPELQKDWAYRATHLMTVAAKQIAARYYGRKAARALFWGCSTGGHQAVTEARRYPDDYDGIIAGAPANNRIRLHTVTTWNWLATHEDPESYVPVAKIPVIHTAVLAACDALDGVTDGVIDDPRKCRFDPTSLVCANGDAADCLTGKQAVALKRIYQGPKDPRTGEQIFPGMFPGAEANTFGLARIAETPPGSKMPLPGGGLLAWGRSWKGPGFDFAKDLTAALKDLAFIDDADPDLSAFRKRGGKLLLYGGWADPLIPAADLVRYFESVQEAAGGPKAASAFVRLFMVPGMGHCSGGDGTSTFDPLAALVPWVEKGLAPEQLVAARVVGGKPVRTRPICAYPQFAKWNGNGSTDDAANFACVSK
jgi:feruloyl esterase